MLACKSTLQLLNRLILVTSIGTVRNHKEREGASLSILLSNTEAAAARQEQSTTPKSMSTELG